MIRIQKTVENGRFVIKPSKTVLAGMVEVMMMMKLKLKLKYIVLCGIFVEKRKAKQLIVNPTGGG